MKIIYNESKKTITIKDNIFNRYGIRFLLIMNLINSLIRIIDFELNPVDFFDYLWIAIGLVSVIGLPYDYLKKTTSNEIQINAIASFVEKNLIMTKRFSLLLKNGKTRDLSGLKKNNEIEQVKQLFSQIGIETAIAES